MSNKKSKYENKNNLGTTSNELKKRCKQGSNLYIFFTLKQKATAKGIQRKHQASMQSTYPKLIKNAAAAANAPVNKTEKPDIYHDWVWNLLLTAPRAKSANAVIPQEMPNNASDLFPLNSMVLKATYAESTR